MVIPRNDLIGRATAIYGDAGRAWVERLPAILMECQERWSLTIGAPFSNLSFNYAAPVTRADGTAAVLKVCFPDHYFTTEVEALRHYDGRGAVRLLAADLPNGALLLERLEPGTPLRAIGMENDERATSITATVVRQLWRPVPLDHPFPTVQEWTAGIDRYRARSRDTPGPLPAAWVDEAATRFTELIASQDPPVLLHGDLHHDNIVRAEREPWLAIDPKGLVGEPAFDIGAFLRNPGELFAAANPARILARRVAQFADELDLDRARIRGWGIAQAVLSAIWHAEDFGDGSPHWLAVAGWLKENPIYPSGT